MFARVAAFLLAAHLLSPHARAEESGGRRQWWLYLYPAFTNVQFTETGFAQNLLEGRASSAASGGLRLGSTLGNWGFEAGVSAFSVPIESVVGNAPFKQSFAGQRFSVEVLRQLYRSGNRLRWGGQLRLGFHTHTLPMIGQENDAPQLGRFTSAGPSLGFLVSAYVTPRIRCSASAKWLPSLVASPSLDTVANGKGGFAYELQGGAQYIFNDTWTLGLFGNLLSSRARATATAPSLDRVPIEVSTRQASVQLQTGYLF